MRYIYKISQNFFYSITKQKGYRNIPLRKRDLHGKNRNIFQQFLIERRVENKYSLNNNEPH